LLLLLAPRLLVAQAKDPYFTVVGPPYRGGYYENYRDAEGVARKALLDTQCPPTLPTDPNTRNPPGMTPQYPPGKGKPLPDNDPSKVDKNVAKHSDGDTSRLDYFMGSWTYLDSSSHDIKVTKWCINDGGELNPPYHDYFAFQIQTSYTQTITGDGGTSTTKTSEDDLVSPGPTSAT